MTAMIASIFVFALITLGLSAVGFKFWARPKAVVDRVMGEVELGQHQVRHASLSFRDLITKVGHMVPSNPADVSILQKRLLTAGYRNPSALKVVYGIKGVGSIALVIITAISVFSLSLQNPMTLFQLLAVGALGWSLPNFVLGRMAKSRQHQIRKGLPNALDMLVICVESGLGLDQALMQVAKELQNAHPEISDEYAVLNLEIRAGKRRAEALRNLGERTAVEELQKLVSVLIQADKFGTSISQTLWNFSDYMRIQSRQIAEEKAAKIGVKLVFPIFFFILPALFVVTIGPMIVKVMRDFLPAMQGTGVL